MLALVALASPSRYRLDFTSFFLCQIGYEPFFIQLTFSSGGGGGGGGPASGGGAGEPE